jgi:hypothetical protein
MASLAPPLGALLSREMVPLTPPERYQTREGQHDDLVLAAAVAAWWGEKTLPALEEPPQVGRGSWLRAGQAAEGFRTPLGHPDADIRCCGQERF